MAAQNNSPFPPELRTASIVPRWSIVYVTQRDTVANHSYFVTVYAHMIARIIKWKGPRDYLMFSALMHDVDETITGDIVSPVKSQIIDEERMQEYVDHKVFERLGGLAHELSDLGEACKLEQMDEVDAIVKAADRMDALFFLTMEARRGNTVIDPLIRDAHARLEGAWRDLPGDRALIDFTWQTVVMPAIETHKTEGGRGV